jgi:hypothetical protein
VGALENYLSDLRDTKLSGVGVSELSYYPAFRQLLEDVGGGLKPKVRCGRPPPMPLPRICWPRPKTFASRSRPSAVQLLRRGSWAS